MRPPTAVSLSHFYIYRYFGEITHFRIKSVPEKLEKIFEKLNNALFPYINTRGGKLPCKPPYLSTDTV